MAFDEALAARVRHHLATQPGYSEKKMFGGLCFLINGNMCCGVEKERLMLRVGPDLHEETLAREGAHPMDFTGRPMKGMVYVDPAFAQTDPALAEWIDIALGFAESLPAKRTRPKTKTRKSRKAQA